MIRVLCISESRCDNYPHEQLKLVLSHKLGFQPLAGKGPANVSQRSHDVRPEVNVNDLKGQRGEHMYARAR